MKVKLKTLPNKPRGVAWRSSVRGVNSPVKSGKQVEFAMRTKLTKGICYMAGLQKNARGEPSKVGVATSINEIEEKFLEISIKELLIQPNRVIMEERDGVRHVYFYHTKISRMLRQIAEKETKIFLRANELSKSYVAGMFDAAGHISSSRVYIKGLNAKDELMLQQLGVYTRNGSMRNIADFLTLIRGFSILLEHAQLPGNERDPH